MSNNDNRKGVQIGVLSVQGDVEENVSAISNALKIPRGFNDDSVIHVKTPQDIANIDGLVIPGGESTTIGLLCTAKDTLDAIKSRIQNDAMPVLGICAGLIILAKSASDSSTVNKTMEQRQPLLDVLDITVQRNAFGRQRQSFETQLNLKPLAINDFKGVFIRAPLITHVGPDVDILCELDVGMDDKPNTSQGKKIIAVSQGNIIATAFHPELSGDQAIHRHFVDIVRRKRRN